MSLDTVSLTTERGKDVVEHNGRLYRKENGAKGAYRSSLGTKVTTYYVCCFSKCKGRLSKIQPCNPMTGDPIGEPHFEEKRTESVLSAHSESCVPDCASIERKKGRQLVLDMVTSGESTVPDAVANVMTLLRPVIGDGEAAQFGTAFQFRRHANEAISRANGHSPSTFANLTSIPRELSVTKDGKDYLLVFESYFDVNGASSGVIVVFATTSDLLMLFKAQTIVVDGTFKIKPAPYSKVKGAQVFTVNTMEGVFPSRRMYRRALALLPAKTEHCYWTFWKFLLQACVRTRGIDLDVPNCIRWKELMCDFELGIHNAFLNIALNTLGLQVITIAACHMHYCSSIIKKIKSLGMAGDYTNEDSGLKHFISKLFALAFLPANLIVPVYMYIKVHKMATAMREYPPMQDFLQYYEHSRLDNPVVPIESWSVFNREDHSKRTTNDLEGKHRCCLKIEQVFSMTGTFSFNYAF